MEERNPSNDPADLTAAKSSDSSGVSASPGFLDRLVATGLGSGFSPVAPGTAGSIVGLIVYFIPGFERMYVLLPAIALFFLWGTFAADRMEKSYGHDPSVVVIDEIVAVWISLAFLPKRLLLAVIGFVVFRMLDVFKPFPASYFDKRNGGISIMMDDVVCGIYTNVLLHIYLYLGR